MLAIGAIIIALWFFYSAKNAKKNPWPWVAAGVVVFYLAGILWIYGVLEPIMGQSFVIHRMGTGVGIKASGIIAGLLAGALVRWKYLAKADD